MLLDDPIFIKFILCLSLDLLMILVHLTTQWIFGNKGKITLTLFLALIAVARGYNTLTEGSLYGNARVPLICGWIYVVLMVTSLVAELISSESANEK